MLLNIKLPSILAAHNRIFAVDTGPLGHICALDHYRKACRYFPQTEPVRSFIRLPKFIEYVSQHTACTCTELHVDGTIVVVCSD